MQRRILFTLFICLPLIGFTQEPAVKYSKDEKAIVATIVQETTGWWTRDYDKWSDAWAHKDYINWSGTNNVMHMEYNGWDELDKWVKTTFEKYPDANETPVNRKNWQFRVYKNGAWVRFIQEAEGITQETRILEKQGGKWKLVHVGWINETSYQEQLGDTGDN